ncbi:MAG TPA: AAA family ATPase [Nitrosopumilaceae archaeon]|nr:AAA family ATPase [Nitrosopumilaceae archaeon]
MADFVDKYRPKRLKDLIGQQAAISKINGMIQNQRISRKILITGPTGVGKTSLMYILAYLFNGVKYGKPLPDMAEYNIGDQRGIDAIREISTTANYAPHGKYRVIILDEIHRVGSQAAPAILKPLEDTKSHPQTIWLLATSEPQMLLPTLIRRCYLLPLQHPTPQQVLPLLQKICQREAIEFPRHNKLLREIAVSGQGQPAICISLLQGAADANTSGANYQEILQAAFTATPALLVNQLAVKCLVGIYRRQPKLLLTALQQSGGDAIALANALLTMNAWLINRQLGKPDWQSLLTAKLTKYAGDVRLTGLIAVHNDLVNLRGEVQRFIFPETHLLLARLTSLAITRK